MRKRIHPILLFFVFAACLGIQPAAAETIPWDWNGVGRIVAIGDVQGAYDNFVAVLKNAGLVNEELRWTGGKTHLVQVGDVVDRGPYSRKCMDLLMDLEKGAKRAGGYVHALIGNHEAMNVVGILDQVTLQEFASYDSPDARRMWERAFQIHLEKQRKEAEAAGSTPPSEEELRKSFEAKYPAGYFGHRQAFGPEGRYGKWIRGHNVSIRVNGIVFSHGDWSEEISALGIEVVNNRIRDELAGKSPIEDGITFHLKGPLQYRGLSEVLLTREQQEAHRLEVDRILANLGATRMVVGHTTTDGVIVPRFGGKHISIDTGMLDIYRGGHQVSLEIEGASFRAIHPGGKVNLPDYLDETTLFPYLEAVAAVDPTNVNVYDQLSRQYLARGNFPAARDVLEHLLRIDKSLPFRYRRSLGDVYHRLGEDEKAREQYLLFIEGFESLIRSTPNNLHWRNELARFCLEQNLRLDVAEDNIRAALQANPEDSAFLLTFGHLMYALGRPGEAVRALEKAVAVGDPGYEAYYYLGLSYLGLDEPAKARQAFVLAVEKDPTRPEAREQLLKLDAPKNQREEGKAS